MRVDNVRLVYKSINTYINSETKPRDVHLQFIQQLIQLYFFTRQCVRLSGLSSMVVVLTRVVGDQSNSSIFVL